MDYYITPEEYERAAANGVKRNTLDYRVRQACWPKERAITTPPRRFRDLSQWIALAQANGITELQFRSRISVKNADFLQAATQPILTPVQRADRMRRDNPAIRLYPSEITDQVAQNGIPKKVFYKRISMGWTPERAAMEPITSPQERGRRGMRTLRQRYGDINAPIFKRINPV